MAPLIYIYFGNDVRLLTKEAKNLEETLLQNNDFTLYNVEELTQNELLTLVSEEDIFAQRLFIKVKKIKGTLDFSLLISQNKLHILLFCFNVEKNPFNEKSIINNKNIIIKEFNLPKPYQIEKLINTRFKQQIEPSIGAYIASSINSLMDLDEIEDRIKFYHLSFIDSTNYFLIIDEKELNLFTLVDYFFENNAALFIAALFEFIEGGESPESLLGLLYKKTKDLCTVKILLEKTHNHDFIAKEIGLPSFIVSKQIELSHHFSLKILENILIKITQTEFNIRLYLGIFNKYFLEKLYLEKDLL